MARRSINVEYALLGFLQPGALHGYQLHQLLNDPDTLGRVWHIKQARVYALLIQLEQEGSITSSIQPQEAYPARHVYELSAAGRRAFEKWLSNPVQSPRDIRQEFLTKLFFACRQGKEAAVHLITAQRRACLEWLDNFRSISENEDSGGSFHWMVLQYRITQVQAAMDWLDQCQAHLE